MEIQHVGAVLYARKVSFMLVRESPVEKKVPDMDLH